MDEGGTSQPVEVVVVEPPPPDEGQIAVMLAHADRCWKAEEANATRIAARTNLVLSGVTAVLGLKLYGASTEIRAVMRAESGWRTYTFWGTATPGMIGMLICLAIVLEVKTRSAKAGKAIPACGKMYLPAEQAAAPEMMTKRSAEIAVYQNTYAAALTLNARNDKRNRQVGMAQLVFFVSAILLFISLAAYAAIEYNETRPETQTRRQSAP